MEIPYEVKARPDTGLWNAKIGIWLFLASEVMLFGGLFSGYVFLRLGSGADPDYHWPTGLLDVRWGLLNTIVLIASSVFVVFAWVKVKLRDWKGFQFWMRLVIICALGFLCIKSYEYYTKFTHYGVKLSDKTIIEGHHLHDSIEYENISEITVPLETTDTRINDMVIGESRGILEFMLQPTGDKSFAESMALDPEDPEQLFANAWGGLFAGKGHDISEEEMSDIKKTYEDLVENTKGTFELTSRKLKRIKASHDAFQKSKFAPLERARKKDYAAFVAANRGLVLQGEEADKAEETRLRLARPARFYKDAGLKKVTLIPVAQGSDKVKPFRIGVHASALRVKEEGTATLHDSTVLVGDLSKEKRMITLDVDRIDLRSTPVPENSIIWKYLPDQKDPYMANNQEVVAAATKKGKEPNPEESERLKLKKHDGHYPHVSIPITEVTFYSNFTPKWNTYMAIYFTLTGLHGLHVLIGALVLAYFLFFGKKMFDEDPEHLANRVEVGGLFWHFVDLVWIFLFPILYLM